MPGERAARSYTRPDMNGEYAWWFLVVGLVVGGALVWLVRGQMAREEDDVAESERQPEADWISRTIERAGGIAPADLVSQILSLHRDYLRDADPFEPAREAPGERTDEREAPAGSPDADDGPGHDDGRADGQRAAESRPIWLERATPIADDPPDDAPPPERQMHPAGREGRRD